MTEGVQWFVWTTDKARVYAYASRADENEGKLFDQWSNDLSYIGSGIG